MSYSKLLNELIEKSGMTAKDIADKCNEAGQKVTASYISILRKEENKRIPSDDISRALAKVLDVDENILVLEAYLDSAPPILKKALRNVYFSLSEFTIRLLGNELTDDQREVLKKEIWEQPLANLVIQLAYDTDKLDFDSNIFYKTEKIDDTQYNMHLNVNPDFEVSDNAMEPILPKGSRTKLKMQNSYQNGEIVAFKEKKSKKLLYRKLHITKTGQQMLIAYNPDYDVMEYDPQKMIILGRVEAVITRL